MTLLELLRRATGYLERNGSTSARLDAELLLAASLGIRRLDLYLQFERPLSEQEIAPFRALSNRRARGEPVAYLLGHKEFMTLDFEVTPAVLVPNPDTEVLVERAVTLARGLLESGRSEVRVADVGTGSGCVAVSVAHFVPSARVWASDDDAAALEVAGRNVARHELADRVELARGDLLAPAPGNLDLILANLPYVAPGAHLPREVLAEPAHALFAEEEGAALINRLLLEAPGHLAPGGVVLAELDEPVSGRLRGLDAYAEHELRRDLAGQVRVLEARVA
ncbi:MAG: peptide chain release factor N(5)-glutamine methyltransferase [Candidatus Dormibacteraeota bacterium]|nr:peptide chain release factor N(5)-glutamine methyltransferase [Candidatus Dormibacteraeota bacterium]